MRSDAATLRAAVFPQARAVTDAVLIVAGAGLVAAAAQISIPLPFTPVPLTGQTFAVLLVGASLGAVRGGAALVLYVLVGSLGAPVFAGGAEGPQGIERVLAATGGYLISYPIVAMLTGWLAERRWDRRFLSAVGAMVVGNVVIYLVALPWLAAVLDAGVGETLAKGLYPFVAGDILKVCLAGALLPGAWRLVDRVRGDSS